MKIKLQLILVISLCLYQVSTKAQNVFYTQSFDTGLQPAGWLNDSLGFPASHVWEFNNPYSRVITGAGFDANFAIFDSDEGSNNDGFNENASLTTETINLSAASGQVFLLLDQQYRALGGPSSQGSSRRIEMSINNGINWTTLVYDSLDLGYPTAILTSYDISAAAGSANVKFKFTYTGSYDWWWAIDNIVIQDQTDPCAGVTLAGTIEADTLVFCTGGTLNLTFTPDPSAVAQAMQWVISTDGLNFTPIAGATSQTYATTVSGTTYFGVILTCGLDSVNISPIQIIVNPTNGCYCYPISPLCGGTDFITNVSFNTLLNASSCDTLNQYSGYSFYSNAVTTTAIKGGLVYSLSVTTNNNNIVSAWIDYNRNNIYEATEWYQVCTTSAANVANTISITVPGNAVPGPTGMRIRSRGTGNPNGAPDACTDFFSGESEDYEILILDSITGLNSINQLKNIAIYPNLTSGVITVDMAQTVENAQLSVVDITGKQVEQLKLSAIQVQTIDLSSLSEGIYFVRINTANEVLSNKIIIRK
jgi:hypothetical protein